jgi:hypothetical protein
MPFAGGFNVLGAKKLSHNDQMLQDVISIRSKFFFFFVLHIPLNYTFQYGCLPSWV